MKMVMPLLATMLACGTQPSSVDASADGPNEAVSCSGAHVTCCAYCTDDVLSQDVCSNGVWACPSGYPSADQCRAQDPCAIPCSLPDFRRCSSCADGGTVSKVCNVDAGFYACPSGSFWDSDPDGSAICSQPDASAD
jgi:hypothetical protein